MILKENYYLPSPSQIDINSCWSQQNWVTGSLTKKHSETSIRHQPLSQNVTKKFLSSGNFESWDKEAVKLKEDIEKLWTLDEIKHKKLPLQISDSLQSMIIFLQA